MEEVRTKSPGTATLVCLWLPFLAARKWGPDTIEGDLSAEELARLRTDQTVDNTENRFLDDEYYASREYDMDKIQVPMLSVANWVSPFSAPFSPPFKLL